MNFSTTQKVSYIKSLFRTVYRIGLGIYVFFSASKRSKKTEKNTPKIFFGGARSGDMGGPLVKVKRLRQVFDEQYFNYNLLYVLSNAVYLTKYAYDLIKKRHIPIIQNQNGVFYKGWYKGDWVRENNRMSIPYHLADYVIYQSRFCQKAAEKYLGERIGDSEILYNAVDTNYFKPYEKKSLNNSEFTFLLSGRIGSHLSYRVESVLKGFAEVISEGLNAKLIISGKLDKEVRVVSEKLINKLHLNSAIKFTGSYTQEEAPFIYNNADAYIMTKHNDPCPNTVIEALSCGLPILYSNTGGIPELVGNNAGIALKCEDDWDKAQVPHESEIAKGMLEVVQNHTEMSIAARNRAVEKYDITYWIDRHKAIFTEVLNK
jgi:glycosyltransferase involved in cell wall biosynthesis